MGDGNSTSSSAQLGIHFDFVLIPRSAAIGAAIDLPSDLGERVSDACGPLLRKAGGVVGDGVKSGAGFVAGVAQEKFSLGMQTIGSVVNVDPNSFPEPVRNQLINYLFSRYAAESGKYGPGANTIASPDATPNLPGRSSVGAPMNWLMTPALKYVGVVLIDPDWSLAAYYDPTTSRPTGGALSVSFKVK